ncbi:MAG: TonB-dependent receptor, partial [Flavisolibacter sp.]|nr:TonB-dependent receptor [Flavisolibacter sp.]
FTINTGLRYDRFFAAYDDHLNNNHTDKAQAGILSPKLNFYYQLNPNTQLYFTSGKGFHSNDTRVVVPQNGIDILPAAYGSDLGAVSKMGKNFFMNASIWYLYLQQEFVYVGDEGIIEPSGKSRRLGFDVSARYQPVPSLFFDVDLNYSHGRGIEEPKGKNYLPLAPVFTSIGGITFKSKTGVNASMRYRYMADRPANADYSAVAKGYFITDLFLNYTKKKYEIGTTVQNLFNVRWKETQFDTESRLRNEPGPVSEIHFTPGTPFLLKASFTYFF